MAALKAMWLRVRSECGAELIEMALVAPLLMMLLAGIFDFGFMFRNWEVITNAAREGARVGVLPDYNCASAGITSRVQTYMAGAGFADTGAYSVQVGTTTTNGFTSCVVRVEMSQPLSTLGVIGQFFGGNFTSVLLVGSSVMRAETQGS